MTSRDGNGLKLNPAAQGTVQLSRLADIKIELAQVEVPWWRHALHLLLLQLSLIVGVFVTITPNNASISDAWKMAAIAMAGICLGFGVSMFLYWRYRETETRTLPEKFRALRARTDALIEKLNSLESKHTP